MIHVVATNLQDHLIKMEAVSSSETFVSFSQIASGPESSPGIINFTYAKTMFRKKLTVFTVSYQAISAPLHLSVSVTLHGATS
jgi:hypothetical protein